MRGAKYAGIGVLTLLALTACGGGDDKSEASKKPTAQAEAGFTDKSVSEILDVAKTDMAALKSLHMKGDLDSDEQKIALDLALATDGGCTGTVGIGGVEAKVLVADNHVYLKGDEDFWATAADAEQASAIAELVGDKWVDAGAEENFLGLCDVDQFVSDMFDGSSDATAISKGEVKDINGVEAIGIVDESDGKSVGWISTSAPHLVLRMENLAEGEAGTVDFSAFDESVDVEAPGSDDVFDLSSFTG